MQQQQFLFNFQLLETKDEKYISHQFTAHLHLKAAGTRFLVKFAPRPFKAPDSADLCAVRPAASVCTESLLSSMCEEAPSMNQFFSDFNGGSLEWHAFNSRWDWEDQSRIFVLLRAPLSKVEGSQVPRRQEEEDDDLTRNISNNDGLAVAPPFA